MIEQTSIDVENAKELAAQGESMKSMNKRIDNIEHMADWINKLAVSFEGMAEQVKYLAEQVKHLSEKFESSVERFEVGQRSHGERIGSLELSKAAYEHLEKKVDALAYKVEALEKEPGQRWKDLVKQIAGLAVAAIFGALVSRFM